VDDFLARHPEAERELFDRTQKTVQAFLRHSDLWRRRLVRRFEAEDVVGELWRRLLSSRVLERFEWRFSGSLQSEIRTVLDRQLKDMARRLQADKRGNGRVPLSLDATEPEAPRVPDPPARDRTPSVKAWTREARAWVRERLEDESRHVLDLWLRDLTQSEITAELGLPRRRVRAAIARIEQLYLRYREG
jgi:RNA polymerase sigma factor (sigma-70 family)